MDQDQTSVLVHTLKILVGKTLKVGKVAAIKPDQVERLIAGRNLVSVALEIRFMHFERSAQIQSVSRRSHPRGRRVRVDIVVDTMQYRLIV